MTIKKKNANDFYIGFEVECIINKKLKRRQLRDCLDAIYPGIEIGDDYSIGFSCSPSEYPAYSAELRTPPLKGELSFKVLEKVFNLLKEFGQTNCTCGLHVNISPVDKSKLDKYNYAYIAMHPVFEEIVYEFGRQDCDYCIPNCIPKAANFWINLLYTDCDEDGFIYSEKSAAINLSNADTSDTPIKYARIEVRAFGNVDYHYKITKIKRYTYKVLKVIRRSLDYQFDYMK